MGLDKFGGVDDQASSDDVVKAIETSATADSLLVIRLF
jgi:hypothetical protein